MTQQRTGWILALSAVFMYSVNSPIARWALDEGIAPETLLAARFVFGAALFGATMPLISSPILARLPLDSTPESKDMDQRGILICLASGFANGLTLLLLYLGLTTLAASLSSVIMIGLIAVFTMIILSFWGRFPRLIDIGRLVISIFGLVLLLSPDGNISAEAVWYTAGAAFFFSAHVVSVQLFLRPYRVWTVTALLVTSASIFALIIWFALGMPTFVPGVAGWVAIVFQAIVATFLGRLVTYAAVQQIGSDQFALLSPLETMLTILWSVIFLQERLLWEQWIGAMIIVFGALMVAIPWSKWGLTWLTQPIWRSSNSNHIELQ